MPKRPKQKTPAGTAAAAGAARTPDPPSKAQISAYMSALGTKGGTKSGAKRMENLSARQRREIALKGAAARWKLRSGRP
jgi:hypothetical protein